MTPEITRRQLLKTAAGLAAVAVTVPASMSCCIGAITESPTIDRNYLWEERATQLEQTGLYTQSNPGMWTGKEPHHVPQVTFDAAALTVTIFTDHPMGNDHWITTHYIRNQDRIVIGLREYNGTDAMARATFSVPSGTTEILAYSHCNLHDDWQSDLTHA